MTPDAAAAFARSWLASWNAHDIDGVLSHFSDDAVFTSPVARRAVGGSDGILRGKSAIREYWALAIARIPDLRFELVGVYSGVNTVVINYRNQLGNLVCEVLDFDGPLVTHGHGTYADDGLNPAGLNAPA